MPRVYGKWAIASVCATPALVWARSVVPEAVCGRTTVKNIGELSQEKGREAVVANPMPRTSQHATGERKKKKNSAQAKKDRHEPPVRCPPGSLGDQVQPPTCGPEECFSLVLDSSAIISCPNTHPGYTRVEQPCALGRRAGLK